MRTWLYGALVVAGCALGDDIYPGGEPLAPAAHLTIVAHQDDDLLFMQPDLHELVHHTVDRDDLAGAGDRRPDPGQRRRRRTARHHDRGVHRRRRRRPRRPVHRGRRRCRLRAASIAASGRGPSSRGFLASA
jgi:hypothetical protein